MVDRGDPDQAKLDCKEVDPCKNSRAAYILPHNSETVIESEKSSINANINLIMGFPVCHQPKSHVTPNFPQNGVEILKFVVFRRNLDQKVKNH